jgi:hypothetical protein
LFPNLSQHLKGFLILAFLSQIMSQPGNPGGVFSHRPGCICRGCQPGRYSAYPYPNPLRHSPLPYPIPPRKTKRVPKAIPTDKQDEPIQAWKGVNIKCAIDVHSGKLELTFRGTGNGGSYDVPNGVMDCASYNHTVPELECVCGFYAVTDPVDILGTCWTAEVELYGTVIVGDEGGFRAQKQRVLSLTPYAYCQLCDRSATLNEPPRLARTIGCNISDGYLIPLCWECSDEKDHVIIPWEELQRVSSVEWHRPFLFRQERPFKKKNETY